jgi:hypothetical protein
MAGFQTPMHSLYRTVRKCMPDELKLLITNGWILLGNPLHRAMKFADAPTLPIWGWLDIAEIPLLDT